MLLDRMIRAARLDPDVYYELERDRNANGQAFAVVLIVAACALIGSAALSLQAAVQTSLCMVGGWLFWSAIAVVVGARFGARAGFEEVIRPVAFAQTPGVLYLLALVPALGWRIGLVAWLWTMVASVIALREVLRVATGKAVLTVLVTSAVVAVISILTGMTFGTLGLVVDRLFPLRG
jgi:hypothetical protein